MTNLRLHNESGLLSASCVYTLICRDEGPLYIKVGMSVNPLQRFSEIRTGNPIEPLTLAWVELASHDKARALEMRLHLAAEQWHKSLEWFMVPEDEFTVFREACKAALVKHSDSGRPPLKWAHVDCAELVAESKARRAKQFAKFKRRGAAYAQFIADGGNLKSA